LKEKQSIDKFLFSKESKLKENLNIM